MSEARKEWADMSADERKAQTVTDKANAIAMIEKTGMPTGLKVVIGGIDYIARPVRTTGSGGVTYNISAKPTRVGKYSARFNKFSFTLLGEGSAVEEASFETETLL